MSFKFAQIEIYKAEEIDLVRLQLLAKKTWPPTFKDILSQTQITYMLEMMYSLDVLQKQNKSGHDFYLAKHDNLEVGFMGIEHNHPEKNTTKIHKIYVLPSVQGMGIGKKLIDYSIKISQDKQQNKLSLNVNRFNKAVQFYEYLGFKIVKTEDIDIGNGYLMEDFQMELGV